MENKHSIKKNYILNLAYQILAVCVPIVTTPYVSRTLQADGIGAYSYTLSIATYFSMFAALGISTYGQLSIAKNRNDKRLCSELFCEIMVARLVTTALILILYRLLLPVLGTYPILYKVMAILIIAEAMDISWFFQGLEEFKITVTRNCIIKLLSTACIFAFVRNKNDLILYAIILQGSTLLGNVLLWPYLKRYLVRVCVKGHKFYKHWKESLVYFIPTVATSVYTVLDKSMIGLFTKSSLENGYYEQAHKIEQILLVFLTSLGTVTLPRLVYVWNHGDKEMLNRIMRKTVNFILMVSFPMMFGICAIADKFIPFFLGDGYEPCISLLRIFSILLVVVGLDNTIGKQCLVATGRQNLFNRGVIAGAGVNFLFNILLIKKMGSLGAACGSVVAECTILMIFLYYSRDIFDSRVLVRSCIRYALTSILMSGFVWLIGRYTAISLWGITVQVLFGGMFYLIELLLIKDPILKLVVFEVKKRIRHQ